MEIRKSSAGRYVLALLATALALGLRELLRPLLGDTNPYQTVWAAIVFSAWYCGLGPSIAASLFTGLGVWYLFLPPYYSSALRNRASISGVVDFFLLSTFIVVLGELNRRAQIARLHQANVLDAANDARELAYSEMEKQVRERTAELEQSNQQLRQLSASLIRSQDDERRRIARELHDSAGQYLGAVSIALEMARQEQGSATRKLEEAAEMAKECASEIRTISHLLHPPLLEELGLSSAAQWYIDGFAARSGIRVEVEIPKELDRLGNDVELVLFRILQESLTNIHRHSGSKTAKIRIGTDAQQVWLEIQDQGKGSDGSSGFRPGIGITGMRERVKDLAGTLEINSDQNGTRVRAVLPLGAKERGNRGKNDAELKASSAAG